MDPDTGKLLWKTTGRRGLGAGRRRMGHGRRRQAASTCRSPTSSTCSRKRRPARRRSPAKPGLYALDPATGKFVWSAPAPEGALRLRRRQRRDRPARCVRAQSAAPAVIPGVVFQGGMDGWFRAYDAARPARSSGRTPPPSRTYDTVNGVKGQPGGGIDGMGPTIAGGMVYITERQQRRGPHRRQRRQRAAGLLGGREIGPQPARPYGAFQPPPSDWISATAVVCRWAADLGQRAAGADRRRSGR